MAAALIAFFLTAVFTGMMAFFIRGALLIGRSGTAATDADGAFGNSAAGSAAPHEAVAINAGGASGSSRAADPELSSSPQPEALRFSGGPESGETRHLPSVSVIVPLRNEEEHATATLESLLQQDYPGAWEIICVDDRSEDGTAEIIRGFCDRDPRFNLIRIPPGSPKIPSPKKRALAAGFAAAKGEILLTTDADCMAPRGWIRSMAKRFRDDIGIVQGPKKIRGDGSLLSRYQEHEVFGLVSIEAATFALGRPMIASAPSLAYRRELYEGVGGFQGLEDSVSGDDDLLVRKMQKESKWKVAYNPSPDACVTTSPATTWISMLTQRARWASNGAHYEEKGFVALLVCVYAFYWWLLLSPILALSGWAPWSAFWIPAAAKILLSGVFLTITSRRLGHRGLLRDLIWCELLHVPIVVVAVILGHLGLYRWK
jgi:cellulose synthase/poly-beta-1,6-N-acetylglucosamine synthase-like glycosyltransferase